MTLSELIALLDQCGVEHGTPAEDTVPCFVSAEGVPLLIVAAVTSDGKLVQFRTVGLMTAPPGKHRRALLCAMMAMNYSLKLVKFGIDPDDGEVVAYLDIVLGGGTLTRKQVERAMRTFKGTVGTGRRRLQKILDSGTDPGAEQDEKTLLAQRLLEAMADKGPPRGTRRKDHADKPASQRDREKDEPSGKTKSGGLSDAIERMIEELEDGDIDSDVDL